MASAYRLSILLVFSFAILVFFVLFFISAPYGKFMRKGWGPDIQSRWAWMIMEMPSPLLMLVFFIESGARNLASVIFLLMWLFHYIHRTFVYPFTQSGKNKPYPVIVVLMAIIFNCLNGFINGFGIFSKGGYEPAWLLSWQFICGFIVFIAGYIINKKADQKFRQLRKDNPAEYVIPDGWLFRYVSNPHYFGEMIEWAGWAVATWSLPGSAFFIFTVANLFPRAISSHMWYKQNFKDYPVKRKAIIPFVI